MSTVSSQVASSSSLASKEPTEATEFFSACTGPATTSSSTVNGNTVDTNGSIVEKREKKLPFKKRKCLVFLPRSSSPPPTPEAGWHKERREPTVDIKSDITHQYVNNQDRLTPPQDEKVSPLSPADNSETTTSNDNVIPTVAPVSSGCTTGDANPPPTAHISGADSLMSGDSMKESSTTLTSRATAENCANMANKTVEKRLRKVSESGTEEEKAEGGRESITCVLNPDTPLASTAEISHDGPANNSNFPPSSTSMGAGDTADIDLVLPQTLSMYQHLYNKDGRIGIYTPAERAMKIARFKKKRERRVWKKKIRYSCRKNLADQRFRVKGRFVKRTGENSIVGGGLEYFDVSSQGDTDPKSSTEGEHQLGGESPALNKDNVAVGAAVATSGLSSGSNSDADDQDEKDDQNAVQRRVSVA